MHINQFDYDLPSELIAQTPREPRDHSRLMVVDRQSGTISHHRFDDLPQFLRPNDLLVANNSRVIPARLFGRKSTGGKVELLLLKPRNERVWEALVGGKRLRVGVTVQLDVGEELEGLQLTIVEELGDSRRLIEFNQSVGEWLNKIGHVPLPPYIHERLSDDERYQTVYSQVSGSAAAPTAGLHFTPELLLTLRDQGVNLDYVTLHVGLDTFRPVTVKAITEHTIHREVASLSPETARRINETKLAGGRVVAIGTTSVRVLESGALKSAGFTSSLREATTFATDQCGWRAVAAFEDETDLYIYPGYTFRAVDMLLTNFHLPKSTLLMLVSAFADPELIRTAYQTAIAERYRFFSFGDAMLIV